ncbi:MAG: biopolymer transporter ExbD, partial [Gemmatimonadetes bacterium]|nr:biopolymer transporter ExbD [Gemmatimonadota bacterium]
MRGSLPAERFSVAADINVTPMIDVMLVLLIIFMVVTPAMVRAELPESRTAAAERDRHPVLVIERSGAYRAGVGDETRPVSPDRLEARLAELYASRPQDH